MSSLLSLMGATKGNAMSQKIINPSHLVHTGGENGMLGLDKQRRQYPLMISLPFPLSLDPTMQRRGHKMNL